MLMKGRTSDDWGQWGLAQVIEPGAFCFDQHSAMACSNLESVHMDVSNVSEFNIRTCVLPVVACAMKLPLLQKISVSLPRIPYLRCDDDYDASGLVSDVVGDLNFYLGLKGKLEEIRTAVETGEMMVWFWNTQGNDGSIRESMEHARNLWKMVPKDERKRDASCWYHVSS
jgi:hypothetical protein